jgi:hypothetical protein
MRRVLCFFAYKLEQNILYYIWQKIKMGSGRCLRIGMMVWLLAAAGCQGGRNTPEQQKEAAPLPQDKKMKAQARRQAAQAFPGKPGEPPGIPPGTCRLVGRVVAVLPQKDPDKQAPCGRVPCRARVRIERLLGYGAAFHPPLAEGQEIQVYFTFTLSPTGKYFPELASPLPGLKAGSLFEADMTGPAAPAAIPDSWFRVGTYKAR